MSRADDDDDVPQDNNESYCGICFVLPNGTYCASMADVCRARVVLMVKGVRALSAAFGCSALWQRLLLSLAGVQEENLLMCEGPCLRSFHLACVGLTEVPEGEWRCEVRTGPLGTLWRVPPICARFRRV